MVLTSHYIKPLASLLDTNRSASRLEFVLIDVKQSKISLRLVGFVGKIKNKKLIASMCLKRFVTRIESEITVKDVSYPRSSHTGSGHDD